MFPDFRYLIYGLTGWFPPEWVGIFKTFGAMVALAFLAATWVISQELKRKEKLGLIPQTKDSKTGQLIWAHQRISEIVIIAAIGGLIGAKIFNAFETWDDFIRDPIGSLFSRSGLTFYGGFIVATIVFYYYARKHKIPFAHLCDAAAPAVMLAYGIGRLGCQLAGDGDWGVFNSAYVTNAEGKLEQVSAAEGNAKVFQYHELFHFDTTAIYAPAPSWAPDWIWSQNYPMNVGNEGVRLRDCIHDDYCGVLPVGVFPTPVYEFIACVGLFFLLWAFRRRMRRPWQMFGIYLILNGTERFFVEKIRVNFKYDWGFLHPTQAEIIAVCLILAGIAFLFYSRKKDLIPEIAPA